MPYSVYPRYGFGADSSAAIYHAAWNSYVEGSLQSLGALAEALSDKVFDVDPHTADLLNQSEDALRSVLSQSGSLWHASSGSLESYSRAVALLRGAWKKEKDESADARQLGITLPVEPPVPAGAPFADRVSFNWKPWAAAGVGTLLGLLLLKPGGAR